MKKSRKFIRYKSDLPDWFNLEGYSFLDTCTDQELIARLQRRIVAFHHAKYGKDKNSLGISEWRWETHIVAAGGLEAFRSILESMTVDNDRDIHPSRYEELKREITRLRQIDRNSSVVNLRESNGVYPVSVSEVLELAKAYERADWQDGYLVYQNDENPSLSDYYHSSASVSLFPIPDSVGFTVMTNIDLRLSDSEIIKSLSATLSKWRDQMSQRGILGYVEPRGYQPGDLIKIRTYKVIPYLDLKIWAILENKKLSPSLINTVLNEGGMDGARQDKWTREILDPLVDKIISRGVGGLEVMVDADIYSEK